ncbi:MAG: helix-turn-helix domain-containing protein [Saprospiraceae bacterium]
MLKYEEEVPSLPLREYIECYWSLNSDFSLKEDLCLPDGSASLIFNFSTPYLRAECHKPNNCTEIGRICMPHQGKSSVLITQHKPIRLMGVRFKPYGVAPFFKVSMTDYTPPFIIHGEKLENLFGKIDNRFWEDIGFQERVNILDKKFTDNIHRLPKPDSLVKEAVAIMVKNAGNLKIGDILEMLCVSKSTLEKKFQEHVGLSPKILCNILRFNSIVYSHQKNPTPSLTELSYNKGFFDQSHLVHNFRSFTGLPPGRFFRQDNHLIEMLRQSFESRTLEIYS